MALLERFRGFAQALGLTFGGERDLYAVFGYKRVLHYQDYLGKYRRQDIATRLVDAEPRALWSNPPIMVADGTLPEVWSNLISGFNLYEVFERLDRIVGLGRYAILVVGLDDGSDLATPVNDALGKQVLYLQPYSEEAAVIDALEESPSDPRFGLPKMYEISPNKSGQNNQGIAGVSGQFLSMPAFKVHHSRVLHIAEGGLEDLIYGVPRMEKVYNLLDDLIKVVGGSSETFWLTANRGLQIDIDKDMDLKAADADALSDEVDEYYHNLRRVIRTRGVQINTLGSDVPNPQSNFSVLISLISAATGIPQRILMGTEAGQLSSEQDRANWAVRIEGRRSLYGEPIMLNPLVRLLVAAGVVEAPSSLTWKWPEAFRMSPLERAQASAQKARTLANVAKALSDPASSPIDRDEGRHIIGLDDTTPIFDDETDAIEGGSS